MTTWAKDNIRKPILNLLAQVSLITNLEPTIATQDLKSPKWYQAMSKKYDVIVRNQI